MSDDKNKIARWDHFRPSNMVLADNQGKYILFTDHEAEVAKYRDAQMTEAKAREVLGDWIREDGSLLNAQQSFAWDVGEEYATIDTPMTAEQLKAIAFWMENKGLSESDK